MNGMAKKERKKGSRGRERHTTVTADAH